MTKRKSGLLALPSHGTTFTFAVDLAEFDGQPRSWARVEHCAGQALSATARPGKPVFVFGLVREGWLARETVILFLQFLDPAARTISVKRTSKMIEALAPLGAHVEGNVPLAPEAVPLLVAIDGGPKRLEVRDREGEWVRYRLQAGGFGQWVLYGESGSDEDDDPLGLAVVRVAPAALRVPPTGPRRR